MPPDTASALHADPRAVLAPLERVVAKYKSGVHDLSAGAPPEALAQLEGWLGVPLPEGLREFLREHNGASLFRGALRIRAAAAIAPARDDLPNVILFADGPTPSAFAVSPDGRAVFGTWDGERLEPLHTTFRGWLAAAIDVLDTRVRTDRDRELLAFAADEEDAIQLTRAGERALRTGRPDEAVALLQRALDKDDGHVGAWALLGDALIVSDRSGARLAWREAFRRTCLPLPYPGAPCVDREILGPLSAAFSEPDAWERELGRFLSDRVRDVRTPAGAELVEAVVRALAASQLGRGRRRAARDTLAAYLTRQRLFAYGEVPWRVHLELASLQTDLGHHDEAEALLRTVFREGPPALKGAALLGVARIATVRHEPWAEELLRDASVAGLGGWDAFQHALLACERAVRMEQAESARRWAARAEELGRAHPGRSAAAVRFARAEVLRIEGRTDQAADMFRAVILEDRPDDELRGRAHLRLGDLIAAEDVAAAHDHYRAALDAFVFADLPLREAWALVRLARLADDPNGLLQAARDRFAAADLAAGMAAVDVARGEPGGSLDWHLERATRHARARHDAQRSRPPWTRADAERPERRLGAHRIALAACGDRVVDALAQQLEACVRAMRAGRSRTLDPPVMRYVAAADLLSAHRSYRAARVLLDQLLARVTDGPAHRSLQGAIARSPNVALADGLLHVIEEGERHPAQSVAEAAELLGLRREEAAVPVLESLAAADAHPLVRRAAVIALGRIGVRSATDTIAVALEDKTLAEPAALALLMLGDRRGVDFHGRALAGDRRDLTGSPGEIVGRYGGPSHLLLLRNVAQSNDAGALGALQGLGLMGDPRAVPVLLDALTGRPRAVAEVASGALQILTGHYEDLDEPGSRARWQQWWEANQHRFPEGVRHRDGRVMDAGLLIERMDDDQPWTRRTAYDELVITTGCRLPFDSDGPWRVQRGHLRAWRRWWAEHRSVQPPGGWYLDGARVG